MPAWFRAYNEALDDPKVQKLPGELFKTWFNVLCAASRFDGPLPPVDHLAFMLRLSEEETEARLSELVKRGLLDRDGENLRPHNWSGRQFESDTSTPRVQKHRNGKRGGGGDETPVKRYNAVSVTPPEERRGDSETESSSSSSSSRERAPSDEIREEAQDDRPFAELTGVNVVPLRTPDPFEAECRALALGSPLAQASDFAELARPLAAGDVGRDDVIAAIAEAVAKGVSCPRRWGLIANWAERKAKDRRRLRGRDTRRPGPQALSGQGARFAGRWTARDAAMSAGLELMAEYSSAGSEARAPPADASPYFEEVWNGFPRDRTASRPKALAAFAELTLDEQRHFAGAIGAIAAHIRGQKLTTPHNLANFIAERRFQGFSAPSKSASLRVRVARDSPQGQAWEAHWRATRGVSAPWDPGNGSWSFETEWPPGAGATGRNFVAAG